MKRVWWLGAVAALAVNVTGCVVHVQGAKGDRGDAAMRSEGWEKLGERKVNGAADTDAILVGRSEGRFSKLMIVVEKSALEMYDVEIEFLDGSIYSPKTRHVFDENTHSAAIDLPGDQRGIKKVTFKYGNVAGGGAAQLELWAK